MTKIGSPVLREVVDEAIWENTIESPVAALAARFGTDARAVRSDLKSIKDDTRSREPSTLAATCPDRESFRKPLPPRKRSRGS
jgi:hypothetical protein